MTKVWMVVVCVCLIGSCGGMLLAAEGGEKAEAKKAEAEKPEEQPIDRRMLEKENRDTFYKLRAINSKIAGLTTQVSEDPELVKLKKAMEDAQKAYQDKLMEKIGALPDAKKLLARKDQIEARRKEIQALLLKANEEVKKKRESAKRRPAPVPVTKSRENTSERKD